MTIQEESTAIATLVHLGTKAAAVHRTAVAQMSQAASEGGPLVDLAESNTVAMLEGLLDALGHSDVTVTFEG